MPYAVKAGVGLATVYMTSGQQVYVYEGSPIPDGADPKHLEHLQLVGLVVEVDDEGVPVKGAHSADDESVDGDTTSPAGNPSKGPASKSS